MRFPSRLRTPTAAVVAVLAAACSSSTEPGTKSLSSTEAQAVMGALFTQVFSASSAIFSSRTPTNVAGGVLASRAPLAATTSTYTGTAACPLGGTISLTYADTYSVDANGTGSMVVDYSYTPRGCVVSVGNRNVTVNGAPTLAMHLSANFVAGSIVGDMSIRETGGFSWSGGNCAVDYTATYNANGSYRSSGTVCGQDVSSSGSYATR